MDALNHYFRSRHKQALEGFIETRKLASSLDDPRLNAILDNSLAGVHKALGNYETAFRYVIDSLKKAQEVGDEMQVGWLFQGIASGSNDLGDHVRALDHAGRGLKIFKQLLEKSEQNQARAGLARCLTEIGTAHHRLGNFDKAEEQHTASLTHYRKAGNLIGEARALNDLGRLHQDQGRYDHAEELHRKSLALRERVQNRQSQGTSLLNLGDLYMSRGDADTAIEYLGDALEIAVETGARLRLFQVHEALARAYEARGESSAALRHYREFHRIKEEVSNDSRNGRIADMEMRFEIETAEKEAEITRLRNVELKRTLDELKAAQDRLVQAEKMASLGAMTAGIAHEIKNPLNFVTNFATMSVELVDELVDTLSDRTTNQMLEFDSPASELLRDIRENAKRILEHGQRADRIVKNMLAHAGGQAAQKSRVDLNRLVEEYVALAYHGARAQTPSFTVAIEQDLDESIDAVEVAPQEIGRVILNLLSNAFDALRGIDPDDDPSSGPKVIVTTSQTERWIELAIRDNGAGIPEEVRDQIFEPFFTTKPTGSGTGLGLSLSYDIVVQGHGGELALDSKPGWTTFVVRLPNTRSDDTEH